MFELPDDDENLFSDEMLAPFFKPHDQAMAPIPSHVGKENLQTLCLPAGLTAVDAMCTGPNPDGSNCQKPAEQKWQPALPKQQQLQEKRRKLSGNIGGAADDDNGNPDNRDTVTPKRKRKFPGPAGILPKLGSNHSMNMLSPSCLSEASPQPRKSPQEEPVLLCSQSSDDLAADVPWQALTADLEDSGWLRRHSIASTLLQASKKQLFQGKATLIFGRVESIETYGLEASISLRDLTGRMQGTVHKDLLKDHEADLQVGSVLVLKQVSIISPTSRNHYLNITPNNVVMVYQSRQGTGLQRQSFHGSEESLHSVLSALEKKALSDRSSLNNSTTGTPLSHSGRSRLSPGGSSAGTPQLFNAVRSLGTPGVASTSRAPSTPQLFNVPRQMNTRNTTPQAVYRPHGQISYVHTTPQANDRTLQQSGNIRTAQLPNDRLLGKPRNINNMSVMSNTNNKSSCSAGSNIASASTGSRDVNKTRLNGITRDFDPSVHHKNSTMPNDNGVICRNDSAMPKSDSVPQHSFPANNQILKERNITNASNNRMATILSKLKHGGSNSFLGTNDGCNDSLSSKLNPSVTHNPNHQTTDARINQLKKNPSHDNSASLRQIDAKTAFSTSENTVSHLNLNKSTVSTNNMGTPEVDNKSRWKFKSTPNRNGSASKSPVLGNTSLSPPGCDDGSKTDTGKVSVASVTMKTPNLGIDRVALSPVETSQVVFRATKCAPTGEPVINQAQTLKVNDGMADLWGDDLSDDILSQLSEEMM